MLCYYHFMIEAMCAVCPVWLEPIKKWNTNEQKRQSDEEEHSKWVSKADRSVHSVSLFHSHFANLT